MVVHIFFEQYFQSDEQLFWWNYSKKLYIAANYNQNREDVVQKNYSVDHK